jgi:hypothetical protein
MNKTLVTDSLRGDRAKLGKPETQPIPLTRNEKQDEKKDTSSKNDGVSKKQSSSENPKDTPALAEKRIVYDTNENIEKNASAKAAITAAQPAQQSFSSARAALTATTTQSVPPQKAFDSLPTLESLSSSKLSTPQPAVIVAAEKISSSKPAENQRPPGPPASTGAMGASVESLTSRGTASNILESNRLLAQVPTVRSETKDENSQTDNVAVKPEISISEAVPNRREPSQTAAISASTNATPSRTTTMPSEIVTATKVVDNLTVSELISAAAKKEATVTTVVGTGVNNVTNSYNETSEKKPEILEKPTNQISSTITSKPSFSLYETITGISQDIPEIIMATNFSPLYQAPPATQSGNKVRASLQTTESGAFFEAQTYIRNQKWRNSKTLQKAAKKEVNLLGKKCQERHEEFKKNIEGLSVVARYLLELNGSFENLRSQLDTRHEIHTVEPRAILRQYLSEYGGLPVEETIDYLSNSFNTNFLLKYNIAQVLNKFGAEENKVKSLYTSTKNWMQLLLELKDTLKTHSLSLLDIKSSHYRDDNSPTSIVRTPRETVRFEYAGYTMPLTLDLIMTVSRDGVESSTNVIEALYSILYEKVNFSNDAMRIAALLNNTSREYRYSKGLLNKRTREELSRYYGYTITNVDSGNSVKNSNVIDAIVGRINDTITEARPQPLNSLASIAQTRTTDGAILTFESRKIEGANNLIAGADWYANCNFTSDGVFDIANLETLRSELFSAEKAFKSMIKGMNLLSIVPPDENLDTIISDSRLLFGNLRKSFIDDEGNPTALVENDVLTPVFALAKTNVRVRSLLFLYLSMRHSVSKSDEYLAAREKNISLLVDEIEKTAKESEALSSASSALYQVTKSSTTSVTSRDNNRDVVIGTTAIASTSSTKVSTRLLAKDAIKEALNRPASSKLLETVQILLREITNKFKANAIEENKSKTLYGGHVDTVVMMSIFDAIHTIVSAYGNQKIAGVHIDEGIEKFVIQIQKKNHAASINEIDERLDNEIVLVQHSSFFVLNTFKNLYNSISGIISYVSHESGRNILNGIANLFSGNTRLLPFIFNDQQIKLFANSVADLEAALGSSPGLTIDVDGDDDFDIDDQFRLLDDSIITTDLKKSIENVFSSQQFVEPNGRNLKIFTVGIPLGFVQKLREKDDNTKLKKSTAQFKHQNDIVKIKLYKIDLINPDIIYKPKEYLFELTRYPVRTGGFIKSNSQQSDGLLNVIRRFPTRDYSDVFVSGGSLVQYLNAAKDEKQALQGESYSFLSSEQKNELYTNHVLSYLLEVYIKIMTGMSTADHHFDMVVPTSLLDESFASDIAASSVSAAVSNTTNKVRDRSKLAVDAFFGAHPNPKAGDGVRPQAGISGRNKQIVSANDLRDAVTEQRSASIIPSMAQTANLVREINGKNIETLAAAVNEASRMLTPMADILAVSKRLILPNMFDRVFNIAADPSTFTIDKEETYKTPYGESTIKSMILNGDIEINTDELVIRKKQPTEGELLFEKYFVAVETVGDEVE